MYCREKWDKAISRYEQAWVLNTNCKNVYKQWGRTLLGHENYEEALVKCKLAIELDVGDHSLHFEWGNEREIYGEAISFYNKTRWTTRMYIYIYQQRDCSALLGLR